jgi:hypothetical protein
VEQAVTDSATAVAQPQRKRKGILLKWSLIATALLLSYFIWEFGSGLMAGAGPSDDAVRRFHSLLDSRNYEELLRESDEGFQHADTHEELLKFFAGVHSKLGASRDSTRTHISVQLTTHGTFVKVAYQSTFERGKATETFTWRKAVDGGLSLFGYNVQSNALLSK